MLAPADPRHAVEDFERDVVEASRRGPVLVDFWAPWCGPCRVLGPTLDRLAEEAAGRWTLRKVNTDERPDLMQRFGIRGIPAVKLFVDGAVSAEFTGALPEYAIRQWLDEHVPSEAKGALDAARSALEGSDRDAARRLLDAVLGAETAGPVYDEAREELARLVVLTEPDRASTLVEGLYTPPAEAVRTLIHFLRLDPDTLPDAPVRDDYVAALSGVQAGDSDTALDRFIQVVQRDRSYDDDGARRATVALFGVLGEEDPVVKKHRLTFNRSLY